MPSASLTALAAATLELSGKPERALEIECGDGDGALFLAREYPSARVRGVDASAEAVRRAVARVGLDPEGRIAFKQGGAASLPYPDAFFDLVVQRAGRVHPGELARVLRAGGHLVVVGAVGRGLRARLRLRGIAEAATGAADGAAFFIGRRSAG